MMTFQSCKVLSVSIINRVLDTGFDGIAALLES